MSNIENIKDELFFEVLLNNSLENSTIDCPFKIPVDIVEFISFEYQLMDVVAKKNMYFEWNIKKQSLKMNKGKKIDMI